MNLFENIENELDNFSSIDSKKTNYILIDNKEKRQQLLSQLLQQKSVAFDTETTGLNTIKC